MTGLNGVLAVAKGGEGVKSGPIGLAVILVLCIAAYFLFKSMSKHLRKVREDFPRDLSDPAAGPRQPAPDADAAPADVPPADVPPAEVPPAEVPPASDAP